MEGIGAVGLIWREMAELSAGDGAIIRSGNTVTIFIIVVIIVITIIMMVTAQHIPTMTKSHHGGEMSVMMKVGISQCQKSNMMNLILEYK